MKATIPVAQYANIQPEVEGIGFSHEEAEQDALEKIQAIWNRVAKDPLDIDRNAPDTPAGVLMRCWASGTEVYFDPIEHVYRSADGVKWLGGSTFAGRFKTPFPGDIVSARMAAKNGVEAQAILDMWALNAHASATVGTATHAALQLRGEYADLSKAVKDGSLESATTKNPILLPLVESFFEGRDHEVAHYECFVADGTRNHCGQIDRLQEEPDGLVVEDFKTNTDLEKKETILAPFKGIVPNTAMGAYWLQLSFYARILIAHGKRVKGLRIYHWTGTKWDQHDHPVLDIDGIIEAATS